MIVEVVEREERSRYIPPPLFAEQDENDVNVTDTVLVAAPLTYTAPPFPEDAAHDLNVVLDPTVPVMVSDFPAPIDPLITAPFAEEVEREMFSNEHDVMVTSLDASNTTTDLVTLTTLDGARVTDVRLSFPDETEKRE